jgi:hypothetical protein
MEAAERESEPAAGKGSRETWMDSLMMKHRSGKTFTGRRDHYQEVTDRIVAALESGALVQKLLASRIEVHH